MCLYSEASLIIKKGGSLETLIGGNIISFIIKVLALKSVVPEGWQQLLDTVEDEIYQLIKSGVIRVDIRNGSLILNEGRPLEKNETLVSRITRESINTCQECGQKGFRGVFGGIMRPLCGEHMKKYLKNIHPMVDV